MGDENVFNTTGSRLWQRVIYLFNAELKEQYAAIQEKEQDLAQLKQKSVGNEILADISGTVVSVDVKAGDTTEPEQALLTIQDATKGYTLSFSVVRIPCSVGIILFFSITTYSLSFKV